MPKYTFSCEKCDTKKQIYVSASTKKSKCTCGSDMVRDLPNLRGLKTTETVDKFSGRQHVQDHKRQLDTRKLDYYWSVEVPKMVNSGVYSIETMLEKEWVYFDEKGNLVTRTKPPQRS